MTLPLALVILLLAWTSLALAEWLLRAESAEGADNESAPTASQ